MKFYKYHGTGNDFILIDNRDNSINISQSTIKNICHRKFGIGADGLMLLNKHSSFDFEMQYFNSDGNEGTMCGNGGRCIVAFAKKLNIINYSTTFKANDGIHKAIISDTNIVELEMQDVKNITQINNGYFLNTGSPHFVIFSQNINEIDIKTEGKKTRNADSFKPNGTNVDFVELTDNKIFVRTYERGVEDETLSCGTGVTASAIASNFSSDSDISLYQIKTLGGNLEVSFDKISKNHFSNIKLTGPTKLVFEGEININ